MLFAINSSEGGTVLLVRKEADIHMHELCKQGDRNGLTVTDRRREMRCTNLVIKSLELHIIFIYDMKLFFV